MYQRLNSIDVPRNVKKITKATLILNGVIGLFVFLVLAVVILALLPLYLPVHDLIANNLDHNNITPNQSTVSINENNWPDVQRTIENLFNLKLKNIQFTNLSNVRVVDTISSKSISTNWCQTNGCLQVLGNLLLPIDCPLGCQLRQLNQFETSNAIEPPIQIHLNSTLNTVYTIEIDAFTVVVLFGNETNGEEITMFLMYNLMARQNRALSAMTVPVDNTSLGNLTHLVNDSIIHSHMNNISAFWVVQANVNTDSSMLNVTVLLRFTIKCTTHCQEIQVNKLKNTTSMNPSPSIVIVYNGYAHFHNVSFAGVLTPTAMTTMGTSTLSTIDYTAETTSTYIIYVSDSIYEVFYKLELFDLIIDGDFQSGPIMDESTLVDLTDLMQSTLSNYTNITAFVFNATIDIDNGYFTTKAPSFDLSNYVLHLIVYYIYPATCTVCADNSNTAVYTDPQVAKLIQIRNATLIDVPAPILVNNLNIRITHSSSTNTISMTTATTHSSSTNKLNSTSSTSTHSTNISTTHATSDYTSTGSHTSNHS